MKTNSLRKWSHPTVVLVISTLTDSPAHTLRVISGLRSTAARLFLVQLPAATPITYPTDRGIPFLLGSAPKSFERGLGSGASQEFLWAGILSEVTVLKNTPVERIPALADSLGADLTVLTTPEIGRVPFRGTDTADMDLFGSLAIPILIFGLRMKMTSSWDGRELHKILVPVAFGPDLPMQLRFACRFARRRHSHLTVLHVFENHITNIHPGERTPLAVEAKLPISELKQEGIMCPMEIAISEGHPERQILSFNERKPHDLILMGGPGRQNSLQLSRPGVTEEVIAGAQCPVLILGSAIMNSSPIFTESGSELSIA